MRDLTLKMQFLISKMPYQILPIPFVVRASYFGLFLRGLGLFGINIV